MLGMSREVAEKDGADLLEKVLSRDNLNRACKRVKANIPKHIGMFFSDLRFVLL